MIKRFLVTAAVVLGVVAILYLLGFGESGAILALAPLGTMWTPDKDYVWTDPVTKVPRQIAVRGVPIPLADAVRYGIVSPDQAREMTGGGRLAVTPSETKEAQDARLGTYAGAGTGRLDANSWAGVTAPAEGMAAVESPQPLRALETIGAGTEGTAAQGAPSNTPQGAQAGAGGAGTGAQVGATTQPPAGDLGPGTRTTTRTVPPAGGTESR